MFKAKHLWWLAIWILIGCGPDTIFLRPGLDTPSQHLTNGYAFLNQNKFSDAGREFERAIELDPRFTDAYIGLGLSYGRRGEIQKGLHSLNEARALSRNDVEWERVQQAFDELRRYQKGVDPVQPTQ